MYAFNSEDLGGLLYVTDTIYQPDNRTVLSYNPLETAAPFDLYGKFESEINEARANNHQYDSDTLRIAKIYYNGSYNAASFLVKVSYIPNDDTVRFYWGYIYSATEKPGSTSQWQSYTYRDVGFLTLTEKRFMGYLYCNQLKNRIMDDTPPGYTGEVDLIIYVGGVQQKNGVWEDPTTSHPYGQMIYTSQVGYQVNPIDIPNCVPVQENWEANRKLQQEIVGTIYNQQSFFTHYTDMRFVSDDGSYNPDPPTPPVPPSEDTPFPPSEPDPYPVDPTPDDTSDTIPIPNMPVIGVSTAGFINVYNPGVNDLAGLGDILFPQFSTPTDIVDAVTQLYNVIANQNLINYVIDCHVIPMQPATSGTKSIKVGYRDTGITVPAVAYDYVDATCGSLSLAEYFNGYADYAATKSKLYLPFIGFVDLKPEFWQAGTLSVDYKFNVIDGSFMCYVRSTSSKSQLAASIIAQYSGNACMHLPLTGVNYAQMVSGVVGAGIAIASGGTASAVAGGAWAATNTIARGGDMQQSNGYNSTAALMGVRTPFLMIERAVPAFPSKYGHDKGYPSNITTQLTNVHGYTEIESIDLSGLPFTADEIEELRSLLKEGVYF